MNRSFYLLLWIILGSSLSLADTLRTEVDKVRIKPGEEFIFRLIFDYSPNTRFKIPEIGDKIQGPRIVEFGTQGPTQVDRNFQLIKWYRLVTDISGNYVLPAVSVTFQTQNGQQTANTSEIFLEVINPYQPDSKQKATAKNEMKDVHDIKPIFTRPIFSLQSFIGFLVLLGALITGLILYFKKKKSIASPPPPYIPPYQRALNELEVILSQYPFQDPQKTKSFHFYFSEIIRRFLEEQYQVTAGEKTFEEIRIIFQNLSDATIPSEAKKLILTLLKDAETIKFTDFNFPLEKHQDMVTALKGLLQTYGKSL